MTDVPQAALGSASTRGGADRLLLQAGRYAGGWLCVLAVTSLLISAGYLLLPAAIGRTVDAALAGRDIAPTLVALAVLLAVLVVCDAIDELAGGIGAAQSAAWLRHALLGSVLAGGAGAARSFAPGDLAGRIVANATEVGRIGPTAVWFFASIVPAFGGIAALALIDPWLALTFVAGAPLLLRILRAFVRDASDASRAYLETQGQMSGRLVDALSGARTIAAAGTLDREIDRVLAPLPDLRRHGLAMWRAQTRASAQQALLVPLLEVAVLAVAGYELSRGRISAGELIAAAQYVVLATGVGAAVTSAAGLARARAAARRAAQVLAVPPVVYGEERLPDGPGRLEFRAVTARVASDPVLDHIDLVVPGGALVAIVGRSGAGKSLLAALAGRLVDPDEGEVVLDGVALPRLRHDDLRRAVSYGFERPTLIGETIHDVIALGPDHPSDPRIIDAARRRAPTVSSGACPRGTTPG